MIEIITENVVMPNKRIYQKDRINNQWVVRNNETNEIIYKNNFENVCLACHNLNKKYYKDKQR